MKTKKNLIFGVGIFLLFMAGFTSGWAARNNNFLVPAPTLTSTPTPIPTITPVPESLLPSPTPPLVFESFKVTRVIDGDTVEIESGEKVRYIGIDTPETVDPRKPVQCFGLEASKKNKELVEGKTVLLEKDITDKDKYSRLLRYVWVGDPSPPVGGSGRGLFINLELVKQGFAFSYTYPPDIKYQKEFLAAEKEAREAKRGLWGACPAISPIASPTASPAAKLKKN